MTGRVHGWAEGKRRIQVLSRPEHQDRGVFWDMGCILGIRGLEVGRVMIDRIEENTLLSLAVSEGEGVNEDAVACRVRDGWRGPMWPTRGGLWVSAGQDG